jgi:oxygen-independent coproporphyrinogen-3 oxidase
MTAPWALYVHVPWCRHVCPYCDFNVVAAAAPPEATWRDAAVRELRAHADGPPWRGRPVRSVYLGGGTPSLLSPGVVAAVLAAVAGVAPLVVDVEVTLEANPGTVDRARLAGYRAAGVTRLSLGAQSFQPATLERLGRDHTPDDTIATVHAARDAGFDNISLDLIYAVPGSTLASWAADVEAAVALAPEHVSAYALTFEPGTPYDAWRARGRLQPVDEDTEAAMADLAAAGLAARGWQRYEISSWARPGFASRHNTAYWDGSDYLGLGPGAHGFATTPPPGRRWVNERDPGRWLARVSRDGTAVAGDEVLTEAQARGDFCWTGLRRLTGVDVLAFHRRFGVPLDTAFPHLGRLVADGLVESDGTHVRLTARGLRFADAVAATFV